MPPVKVKTPTLAGGISQQPPHLRFSNQVELAYNAVFDVADGASKRPGTEFIYALSDLDADGSYQVEAVDFGEGAVYIAIIGEDESGDTVLRVIQPDGREATVNITTDAQTYLDAGDPGSGDFRFATNTDLSVICNRMATAAKVTTTLTPTTMPVKLVRTTAETSAAVAVFDVGVNAWSVRSSGDDTNNPGPSVALNGLKIKDVAFYRNRLVMAGSKFIAMSRAADYFQFFLVDQANIVDDDTIEVALTESIQSVKTFKKALVVFTESGRQYESNTPDLLTPTAIAFDETTTYETKDIPAVAAGSALYFMGKKTNGSILYEYLYSDSQISNVAADTTRHVEQLLPENIRTIDGSSAHTTMYIVPNNEPQTGFLLLESGDHLLLETGGKMITSGNVSGANRMYVYRYYWNNEEKLQSAWSIYTFGELDSIADISVVGNFCYMLTKADGTTYVLERLPMGRNKIADDGMPFPVHLDRWQRVRGVYNAPNTTWPVSGGFVPQDAVVLGAGFGGDAGKRLDGIEECESSNQSGANSDGFHEERDWVKVRVSWADSVETQAGTATVTMPYDASLPDGTRYDRQTIQYLDEMGVSRDTYVSLTIKDDGRVEGVAGGLALGDDHFDLPIGNGDHVGDVPLTDDHAEAYFTEFYITEQGPTRGGPGDDGITPSVTSLCVTGDYSRGDSYLGQVYPFYLGISQPFRRDRSGQADILGDLMIYRMGAHHFDTGDYTINVEQARRALRQKSFEVEIPETGTLEAYYQGQASQLTTSIQSTSQKPTTISAFEVDANFYPRA